jgi:hypothetical protein
MRRLLFSLASLLIVASAMGALDDKDKPKPDKPQAPAEQYKALADDFAKAQKEFETVARAAKTPDERKQALEKRPNVSEYAGKMLDLADKNPKDPVAVDALVWVVANSFGMESQTAQDILFEKHLSSPKLAQVALLLGFINAKDPEKRLRLLMEKSPHRGVQGQACYSLAQYLKRQATRPAPGKEKGSTEAAEKLFEEVVKKYADVEFADSRLGKGPIGKAAQAQLVALRNAANLAEGKEAPQIEGEDIDGKQFKLTDYRGKVVLLDFWGHW